LQKVQQKFYIGCESKSVRSPLAPNFKLIADMSLKIIDEHEYMSHVPYTSAMGSLIYVMMCTRSDLSQAMSMILRYMHGPGKGHREVVRWIFWYIKGTVDVGLIFKKNDHGKKECKCYVDSDCVGDLDKHWSTIGVFTLSQAPMSWHCNLQFTVIFSMIEDEYMTSTEVVKEAIWPQGLMDDLRINQDFMKVHCDSISAIYLAKKQVYHAKMKHIDVRYHFVRDILEDEDIELKNIHTQNNPMDMHTKVISRVKFNHYKNLLCILPVI